MAKGYYLISKTVGIPYYKYKGDALRLINKSAWTVDEIIAGNTNIPNLKRKITTFRDSNGNIFERAIDFSDKPYRNRIYSRWDNIIGDDKFVVSTNIKEYTLSRNLRKVYEETAAIFKKNLFWTPVKFITNHLSINTNAEEKVLSQVQQTNMLKPQKENHCFIEFPHIINGKIWKNQKKILRFSVNTLNGHKVNSKSIFAQGVKVPAYDSFLGLRALDINESKYAFTQKFLLSRGLGNKNIHIDTDYLPQNNEEELIKAMFDPNDGKIKFIKNYIFKTKSEVCATSGHEVEHGWQFYLHARNTQGGTTPWEEKIYEFFNDLPKKLKKEADEYTESIQNYVTVIEDRNKYRQNFIEIKANEAGQKARILYDYERTEIQNEFRYIPGELL